MSALIIVDVQYDFIDGSLAVNGAHEILPVVHELLDRSDWDLVVASQDFHPAGHVSFATAHELEPFQPIRIAHPIITQGLTENPAELRRHQDVDTEDGEETMTQMLWPDHCVQGTRGAAFEDGVCTRLDKLGLKAHIIQKGCHPLVDGYSAFAMNEYVQFTELPRVLFSRGITKVTIAGLATDYCVRATAIDARKFQLDVDVVRAGVRGVDATREDEVLRELERWGCRIV